MATTTRVRVSGGQYATTGAVVELYVTDCPSCGVVYAITSDYQKRRYNDGQSFYCPNGHTSSWHENEADRQRKARELAERQLEYARAARTAAEDQARTAEYQRRAAKGQLTKTRKRVAHGVCPCCNRTFQNLAQHMAGQHPDYAAPEQKS